MPPDDRIQALTKLLADGLAAAEGARVTLEAWADDIDAHPHNHDNYCRLLDWMRAAKTALTEKEVETPRQPLIGWMRDARAALTEKKETPNAHR